MDACVDPWKKTFYGAFVGQFLSITGFFVVVPLLPLYLMALHPDLPSAELRIWAGWTRGITGLVMAFSAPLWGVVADRYGRKPMVLRAMFGGVLVLLLMAFAQNLYHLLALRALQGILTGTATAVVALVSSITPRERSGYALGMMSAAVFGGATVGPFLGGEIADAVARVHGDKIGFQVALFCAAGIVFLGAMVITFFTREQFERPQPTGEGRFASFAEMFGTAGFFAALLTLFLVRFGNSSFQPIFPYFLEELTGTRLGLKALTGRIIGVAGLAAAVSAGILGRFGDKWGHKHLLTWSVMAAGLVTLALRFATNIPQVYVMRALFGFAAAGIMPSANAIIRRIIHEKHLGKAYGILASITGLGWGIGSLSGGYLSAAMGLRAPFVLTAVVLFVSGLIVAWQVKEA